MNIAEVFGRFRSVYFERTFIVLPTSYIRSLQLSLFTEVVMVPHCRLNILQVSWSQEVVDHTHATNRWEFDALHLS